MFARSMSTPAFQLTPQTWSTPKRNGLMEHNLVHRADFHLLLTKVLRHVIILRPSHF